MNVIRIPELEGYFGGKGGAGVYQNIINIIPPHSTFIVTCLGHCGITRNMLSAYDKTICCDLSKEVINAWQKEYDKNHFFRNRFAPQTNWRFHGYEDKISFLRKDGNDLLCPFYDKSSYVFYCDPPYPTWTRKSNKRYLHDWTKEDHISFLEKATAMKRARILISTYDNELYREYLKGWNTISFQAKTRGGMATETVYFNYDKPTRLHDYRYIGSTFKKREHLRLKKERFLERFKNIDELERHFLIDSLFEEFPYLHDFTEHPLQFHPIKNPYKLNLKD